jgi:tripartite-type tricarboxylate transporter receptor subunit TctC
LAERVKDSLGTVIVENRPGAGGNIGADFIAKAAPDGLTIGIAATTATHAVNPWLYSRILNISFSLRFCFFLRVRLVFLFFRCCLKNL